MARYFHNPLQGLPTHTARSGEMLLGRGWRLLAISVIRLSEEETLAERKRFSPGLKEKFRQAALELGGKPLAKQIKKEREPWEIHHVVPLGLGGEHNRVVYMPHVLHRFIHDYMRAQTNEIEVGGRRTIRIPVLPQLIWTSEKVNLRLIETLAA